eukprot:4990795-Pleurochrysis_carterae.AAC.2
MPHTLSPRSTCLRVGHFNAAISSILTPSWTRGCLRSETAMIRQERARCLSAGALAIFPIDEQASCAAIAEALQLVSFQDAAVLDFAKQLANVIEFEQRRKALLRHQSEFLQTRQRLQGRLDQIEAAPPPLTLAATPANEGVRLLTETPKVSRGAGNRPTGPRQSKQRGRISKFADRLQRHSRDE